MFASGVFIGAGVMAFMWIVGILLTRIITCYPSAVRKAMKRIVRHYTDHAFRDFLEMGRPEGHIYHDLHQIREYLRNE